MAIWLPGFLIYAGTIYDIYRNKVFDIDLIYRAYVDFLGHTVANNLKSAKGMEDIAGEKIRKEVARGQMAVPFT